MAKNWIKDVSFLLAILILFVSVVQVGLSTFWPDPEYPTNDCYRDIEPEEKVNQECLDQAEAERKLVEEQRDAQHRNKFIIGTVLSLLAIILVLFVKLENNIVYGLFGGAIINQLFTLRFVENRNITGFIILLVLFILVIFFVQKKSKK